MPEPVTSAMVKGLIRSRYAMDRGWATLEEVGGVTERGETNRRYDALAVSLWQSMGVQVHGFEVKVSRSDWLTELRNPAKSAPLMRQCTHWWVVAPAGVVMKNEVPNDWGWLQVTPSNLRMSKSATVLPNVPSVDFWRMLLQKSVYRAAVDENALIQKLRAQVQKEYRERDESRKRTASKELTDARTLVEEFEKQTGLRLHSWDMGTTVEIVKLLRMIVGVRDPFQSVEDELSRLLKAVGKARQELRSKVAEPAKAKA